MAIENAKTLNVRIRNKYDSYENWAGSSLVLEPGEIAIAYTTVNVTVDNGTAKHPALLMKVGNGTDTFDKLPWLSAKAADVLEACKSETDLTAFVNNVIANAGIASSEAMNVLSGRVTTAEGEIDALQADLNTAETGLKARVTTAEEAIDALEELVGTDSVEDQIEAAIAALNLETTYVKQETGKSLMTDVEHTKLSGISEGANKVEKSDTNGNIKVDGSEVVVYTHPEKHAIGDVTGLQDALDDKEAAGIAEGLINDLVNGADGQVKKNTDAIALLNGNTEGSVRHMVGLAKSEFNGKIGEVNNLETTAKTLVAGVNEVHGELDAAVADIGNVDALSTENKTVVSAINEVLAAVGTGGTAAVVTVTSDITTEGALKSYTIKQGDTTVGVIDIPKDMVVESGSVVKDPEGQEEGTYIKLVLANVADPLYINVGHLVDIYTAKAGAQEVQIAIDSDSREISASIVSASISATKLAPNAVTTAKIADNNVTKDKLSTAVQTSLDNADAAKAAIDEFGDIVSHNASEFATDAQGAKADTAVQKVKIGTSGEIAPDANGVVNLGDKLTVHEYLGLGSAALKADTDFKTIQTAVDSGENTNKLEFVDRIQQNSNGNVTVTKHTLETTGLYDSGLSKLVTYDTLYNSIVALDSSVAATAADGNQVSVLTGVVKLAAIALTGSTDDIIQGALTLVFDCGGAE